VAAVLLQLADLELGAQPVTVLAQLLHLAGELVTERLVERSGAEQDAQRQSEEDRDERDEVVAEVDQRCSYDVGSGGAMPSRSWMAARSPSSRAMTMRYNVCPNSVEASATTIASSPASASSTICQVEIRVRYSWETPLASMSLEPTRSRVRKVEAMPARPLSRNSTSVAWVPTATMSSAPLSSASSMATSSLVPVAGKTTWSMPRSATRAAPGARPSR